MRKLSFEESTLESESYIFEGSPHLTQYDCSDALIIDACFHERNFELVQLPTPNEYIDLESEVVCLISSQLAICL